MADAMYAPVVTRFVTYDVKLEPQLKAYADTIMAMPEMQEWIAAAKARAGRDRGARGRILGRLPGAAARFGGAAHERAVPTQAARSGGRRRKRAPQPAALHNPVTKILTPRQRLRSLTDARALAATQRRWRSFRIIQWAAHATDGRCRHFGRRRLRSREPQQWRPS